jgi:hypothetical protein
MTARSTSSATQNDVLRSSSREAKRSREAGSEHTASLPSHVRLLFSTVLALGFVGLSGLALRGVLGEHNGSPQPLFANDEDGAGLIDSDNDLLPDDAEWTLLGDPFNADTDGDGTNDFIEAIEHESLASGGNPQLAPTDGFRLVVNTTLDPQTSQRFFWIHMLYRLPSGQDSDVRGSILLFRTQDQREIDLTSLLFSPLMVEQVSKIDPKHGLLKRITLKVPETPGFQNLAPSSFRSYSLVNQKVLGSGTPLLYLGGAYHVVTHLAKNMPGAPNERAERADQPVLGNAEGLCPQGRGPRLRPTRHPL